jgi:hypothetical protein
VLEPAGDEPAEAELSEPDGQLEPLADSSEVPDN